MSNVVIAAIPDENDRVWKVSSEKVPHLTLLFLGDVDQVTNLEQIVQFVEHAASTTLRRFYLPVDRRDVLGADEADVLFFKKNRYDFKAIRDFRATLLQDQNIKTAYDSAEQFEGSWQPHLTLGYPTAPAKPLPYEFGDQFYSVDFNKIAVWVGDYEGPEFLLKDYWDDFEGLDAPMDVAMSSISTNDARVTAGLAALEHVGVKPNKPVEAEDTSPQVIHGEAFVDELMHYGTKGMRWGFRKGPPTAVAPTATSRVPHGNTRKTKIETEGGQNHPAHDDAIKVAQARVKLKKSGTAALSNQELREVADRIRLEEQVKVLTSSKGKRFVLKELESEGKNVAKKAGKTGAKKVGKAAVTALVV